MIVFGFRKSPYKVTQAGYQRLTGINPGSFKGDNLLYHEEVKKSAKKDLVKPPPKGRL